jgi:deoxyribonuclease V
MVLRIDMEKEQFLRLAANPHSDLNNLRFFQERIASEVILKDDFELPIKYIGGVDSAYIDDTIITACVILKWPSLEISEQKLVVSEVKFPYISTFFAFREGPSILQVLSELEIKPTILLFDSHGIAHPVFAGCASHIGVLADLPTIGVAKENLCGTWKNEPIVIGEWCPIEFQSRVVGAYYLSQKKMKPIVISIGHRISLKTAIEITRKCIKKQRQPEPIVLAHQAAILKKKDLAEKV